jgi:hypothetical protein
MPNAMPHDAVAAATRLAPYIRTVREEWDWLVDMAGGPS